MNAEVSEIERLTADPGPDERYVDSEDPAVSDGYWRIENVSSLDWALSRVADLEREKAENAAIVEEHIQRLKLRLEKLNERIERGLKFFRSQIQAYAEQHRAELLGGGKKKSRALPHGTVGWKKVPAKAVVTDKDALLAWARAQPVEDEVLRVKEEPAWDSIKARVEKLGEAVPGTDYQPEGEALVIKTTSEEA